MSKKVGRLRPPKLSRTEAVSWRDVLVIAAPAVLLVAAVLWVGFRLVRPAPPDTIRLLSGPSGSTYLNTAEKYKAIIERYGVRVEILPSKGSLDNLQRLADRKVKADVAFVQSGLTDVTPGLDPSLLMSLGTLFAQPLMVYHRQPHPVDVLSQLKGKRLAIGPEGSGTRALALKLLKANEMDVAPTTLLPLSGEEAAKALAAGTVDAVFLMGDSATPRVMRGLRDTAGVDIVNFRQAQGYVRRFRFLTKLTLPEGAIDLAKNYPPRTTELIGPTVELVARTDLHPALSDLLISAAREVHSPPGLYRDAGQFPAAQEHDFPLSPDAERYYKSGTQFFYKRLPFWVASLLDRLWVLVVPLLVLLVPATRLAPAIYRWRVRSRIYRWYGALMEIDRDLRALSAPATPEQRDALGKRLTEIEDGVNEIRTPLAFADQLYVLRDHVSMVRRRLVGAS